MDDDDFDLTMEEMDALEKEALERINQERNHSSSLRSPNKVFTFSISFSGFQIMVLTLGCSRFVSALMCDFLLLRSLIRFKGPGSYLHLLPLNQTLVSWFSTSNCLVLMRRCFFCLLICVCVCVSLISSSLCAKR